MNFAALQANLRRILLQRIERGTLTGAQLGRLRGYRQPHISNFLNGKRGLSLTSLDRILQAQGLSVADLLDPWELRALFTPPEPSSQDFLAVPVMRSLAALSLPQFTARYILESIQLQRSFLESLRTFFEPEGSAAFPRRNWLRFVAVAVDARQGMAMYPRLLPGARVLVDRHYNSLTPYRKGEDNIYAVHWGRQRLFRYVRQVGNELLLRPENRAYPMQTIPLTKDIKLAKLILGRVCRVETEV